MRLLTFADDLDPARALGKALDVEVDVVAVHEFPDGESRVTVPTGLDRETILYRSLDHPNGKLVNLLLAAEGARNQGASELTLVAPYLCYMRQDAEFRPGEVVSQRIVGRFLADHFEGIVTVDPHLHRVSTLAEAVPARRAIAVSAASAMGGFLARRADRALLVGPDAESLQWVSTVAEAAGLEYVVGAKHRLGDRRVEVTLPDRDYHGIDVVLVDDVASTGHTLAAAAGVLVGRGARRVDVLVTHALFAPGALELLGEAGVSQVWSSDSIRHPSNAVPLAPLLAAALG